MKSEDKTGCLRSPANPYFWAQLSGGHESVHRLPVRAEAGQVGSAATFSVRVPFLQLGFGDVVKLVGEQQSFGGWSLSAAPALAWTEGHNWVGTFELAPDTYQFKVRDLVIEKGECAHCWQPSRLNYRKDLSFMEPKATTGIDEFVSSSLSMSINHNR